MINLLPKEVKDNYRYGRLNVALRKWVVALLLAIVGLGVLATYGLLTIQQSTVHYREQIASNEALLKQENYSATQEQVKDIGGSFKLAAKVLGQEVLFSQLIKQIAATIPANANLTGLTIAQTQGAMDISAVATDYNTATQVQVNLADPKNKIFTKADIVSINCDDSTTQNSRYPCKVEVKALFSKDNPFLFINSKGKKP